ncbi:MAG: proline/glycine betaine ABC transporter permease [Desulfitobacteriaceae bacterium]|nr:proline/glycine betaine ABC transporter permease [Desulfitobacteriaceae bacterium]MDD4752945.1 proline/glycine betaine ABC transporter permease [Desulfitobacteriaceae bacterium]
MHYFDLPLEEWTNLFINEWFVPVLGGFFDIISDNITAILVSIEDFLLWIPPEIITLFLVGLAWRLVGWRMALFSAIGLLFIGSVDLWDEAMRTLAIVLVATVFSIIIGIPVGIWSARSSMVDKIVRPILDFMQTLPSFVYLIPTILLFGIGGVSAVIATFIFATPPAVRLTNLGIRQVPEETVEAARAFGSSSWQMLTKVQFPLALPTIMAGVNQTILLALSMAVIASMIGAPGLGSVVLTGISRVNVGLGLVGGLCIVVLAIILDRITQTMGGQAEK